jgi:RNA polymerase-binding protein DksA
MSIDTEHFRARLLDERRRVLEAIENLRRENPGSLSDETGELNPGFDQHPGDVATELYDRELEYTLQDGEQALLVRIDRALARIDDGTYGTCERCGKDIPVERLEARPWAELDIDCQREVERVAGRR